MEEKGVILLSFLTRENNSRIGEPAEDVSMNRVSGIVGGVILFLLIGFVISIFQIHAIEKESQVIGTLYALGVTRREMMRHYLQLPFYITFVSSICGTVAGFSSLGLGIQLASFVDYYSLPDMEYIYPLYLIVYGLLVPSALIVLVNLLLLHNKLNQKPVKLLRHERRIVRTYRLKLHGMRFTTGFMIRQLIREYRCRLAMAVGVFLSMLLLVMAMNIHVCIWNLTEQNRQDCTFWYMYILKDMPSEVPEGAVAGYVEEYNCAGADGSTIQVWILGINAENPYFSQISLSDREEVTLSSSLAIKLKAEQGDTLFLEDTIGEGTYEFSVFDVGQYSIGTYAFMDLDTMRGYYGTTSDYYNVLFSEEELDIDSSLIYSVTSREDIQNFSEVLNENMLPLTIESAVIAILIFVVIIYLMMKFMIDRSEFSIALMRIFGYSHRELYYLYMSCDIWIFLAELLISIPLAKAIMDAIWPMFVAHVSVGLDLTYGLLHYASLFLFTILVYVVVMFVLSWHLLRLELRAPETLKERE
ncbi:MAG: ABC transporter permease [Lachnospiraceae bacterium]|nr:ABC transporter permease [Lachnospiraceae bacterium]